MDLSLQAPAEPGPGPDCYTAPTDPACADFRQPDETSEKEIEMLCSMMPGMIGCTLWATCQVGGWREKWGEYRDGVRRRVCWCCWSGSVAQGPPVAWPCGGTGA